MKQKLKKTLNEYQHELIMLKAEHLELLIWYKTICELNGKSQKENAEFKHQLEQLQNRYDLLDSDWVELKKEKLNYEDRIHTYQEILDKWEKVVKLFGNKIKYGESITEQVFNLVKEFVEKKGYDYEVTYVINQENIQDVVNKLEKENAELKQINDSLGEQCRTALDKLASIKTLEKDNLIDLVVEHLEKVHYKFGSEAFLDAICKLAIPADKDSDVSLPPLDSFPVTVQVTKIVKGEPSICEEE